MTPKEKAKELINIFCKQTEQMFHASELVRSEWMKVCKLNAISCVDEILKSFDSFMDARKNFRHELEIDAEIYWQQVKSEINNI